jgi:hypothetical protein
MNFIFAEKSSRQKIVLKIISRIKTDSNTSKSYSLPVVDKAEVAMQRLRGDVAVVDVHIRRAQLCGKLSNTLSKNKERIKKKSFLCCCCFSNPRSETASSVRLRHHHHSDRAVMTSQRLFLFSV